MATARDCTKRFLTFQEHCLQGCVKEIDTINDLDLYSTVGDQSYDVVKKNSILLKKNYEGGRGIPHNKMAAARKQIRTYDAHFKHP